MAAPIALSPSTASNLVTSGNPYHAILRLALPTVIAMLTQSFVNQIDIVFFSWLPLAEASDAHAALLPSLIIIWIFGGSLSAISVGTQAFTARRFAEKKNHEAGAVLANAALFALIAGIVFSLAGYASMRTMLGFIVKTKGAHDSAVQYLSWRLLGITSMVCAFAFKAFFDGIGKTHVHLVAAIVMNGLNILFCLLFIFGVPALHIPHMGIAGAGFAGFASTWFGLFVMIGYALKHEYRTKYRPFHFAKLDIRLIGSILKLSVPGGVATIVVMTGFLLFARVASMLDVRDAATTSEPANAAATTVIVGVLTLTFTACMAFGTSTATLVAQSLGEKDPEKAERFGWTSTRLGLLIFGFVGAMEALFADRVLAIATHSEIVRDRALLPMRMMGAMTPLIAVAMILTQALFGAGNTMFVMIVELCLHFICLVPLAYIFGIVLNLGLPGLWTAAALYIGLLALFMSLKFRSGDWKTIKL